MSNEWEDTESYKGVLGGEVIFSEFNPDYEYKVMRRKVKTERDEFIEKAEAILDLRSMSINLGKMYDAGARFK